SNGSWHQPSPVQSLRPATATHETAAETSDLYLLTDQPSLQLDPLVAPIRMRFRTAPLAIRSKIDAELDHLIAQGVLEPVPLAIWETPIVTPLKPNGEVRICADYKWIPGVMPFSDGVLIATASPDDFASRLCAVLRRFDSAGLKVKREKCLLGVLEVDFLGFRVDVTGLHPTKDKVKAIVEAPASTCKAELQAFLGLINFYPAFLPHKAAVVEPLHRLLDRSAPWTWGPREVAAFRGVKALLISNDVLAHFDESLPIVLACNASPYGVGVVLGHILPDGHEVPVAYYSRTLTAAERNYAQIDRKGSEEAGAELTPSPDFQLPRSIADKDLSLPNGTPVDTSSPASSSSLLNRLQLDDDLDGEMRDLFVTVDDPKKHVCTMETYITYRVTTKTTRAEFDLPEYSMRRRYQDFDWLRNKLEESQPTHLIPPLPEKFVVKGVVDRFSEEFVETRRKALDKFLKRIADHPVLSFNEHFHVFLTAKDLNAYKKQGMALLSKMGESVKYVTGSYKLRSRPLEFAAIGDYLDTFSMKLGTIDRIAQRIIKEEVEYLVELREYGPVYSTWSGLERELSEPLEGVSACIGNCCTALEELSEDMTEDFLPVLREYILYAESMKNVLKKRDQVQAEYEAKLEAVVLKREDRPKVPTDVEKCQDRVECFNADLKADMERWQNNKRQDFRQLLMGMADKNIQYYEKCLTAWESIIPLLQEKPETK
ncbi:PREDICTED: sorting nexin-30, partial [Gekko japonicus]|uniref:Sorting nexin-30 n=1 Tax=Gekko japonicus TaxID=146911 RepID=A0ABM1KGR4_GEKJA